MVMAHVPLNEHPSGVVPRLATGYTKRRFGQTVEPLQAAAHHSGVLAAMGALETAAQFGWKKLDPSLRWLAVQVTSMRIGCSWCVDYGYFEGMHKGVDPAKVRAVGQWRSSDLFDERERIVLE
jgi:alkylhydroperoxidase family enzyme